MPLQGLVELTRQARDIQRVAQTMRKTREFYLTGLSGTQKTLITSALRQQNRTLLVVSHSQQQAERMAVDFQNLLPDTSIAVFSPNELLPHEEAAVSWDLRKSRLEALKAMQEPGTIVCTSIQALLERMPPPHAYYENGFTVTMDTRFTIERLAVDLVRLGYERVEMVEGYGQFSIRGGIVDVFPFTETHPVRVELFDDEVDSIRQFSLETQRSLGNLAELVVLPAQELLLLPEDLTDAGEALWSDAQKQATRLHNVGKSEEAESLLTRITRHRELLLEHNHFGGMAQYQPYIHNKANLLEYLPSEAQIVFDEPARLRETARGHLHEMAETVAILLERGKVLPSIKDTYWDWTDVAELARKWRLLYLSVLDKRIPGMENVTSWSSVSLRLPEHFNGNIVAFGKRVAVWRREHYRVLLVTSTDERARSLVNHLRDMDIPSVHAADIAGQLKLGNCVVTTGSLETGLDYPGLKLAICTDLEMYGKKRARQRVKVQEHLRLAENELRINDYVVHVNHGIGQYLGVKTLEVAGVHKDYLVVQYAGNDRLYVPTDQINLLQRYVGLQEQIPRLSKLGGGEWSRVKKRVKESVQEMAEGLLQLYAEREAVKGHAFPTDTPWQKEFEEAFPYDETPDQMKAIEDAKTDMERQRPMDRLVCGDVGYGKTEVAIRAAFKAVGDSKQVVVLVPTTILAQQHHRTFLDRFDNYPVKLGVLSRFQSHSEQSRVVAGLKNGTIDVVIGTHRLLSKDIEFRDLGLVVVDEEQRFGVAQKERLKEMAKKVDVLTLSATPIPRTLHMAMVGVRDMSLIETPPEDRFPIRTYVLEYDPQMIRQAISRELARQGQVYFVYNRIQGIERMFEQIQDLVPEARIAIGHGQMDEAYLEQVMLDFYNGEYDVLLCTTIIETGMDISNVNTLIVYAADHLGLAQLYQLRGRVGRTNRVAYAYFTYRKDKILSEDAEKRLQAIKEFTELGSGIKIAMRDLEIRGAGNILGPEQHGFISSVGFELYCRLLEEAIRELKGDVVQQPPEPVFDLDVDAYISDEFVHDSRQKVELYKRIMTVTLLEHADAIAEEIEDRFGDVPDAVANLLQIARIKVLARTLGVASISAVKDTFVIKLLSGLSIEREVYSKLVRKHRGQVAYQAGRSPALKLRVRDQSDSQALALLFVVLRDIE